MYGFEDYFELTPDQLLQKVTPEEIFKWIFKVDIDEQSRFKSPFRKDENPDCRFETRLDGTLLFVDFGDPDGRTHRTCFRAVMDHYQCSLPDALKRICIEFGLSENKSDYTEVKQKETEALQGSDNIIYPTIISTDKRPDTKKDRIFWNQFLISMDDLKADRTGIVERVHIDSKKGKRSFSPIGLCYEFYLDHHVKLYQPYNNPKYKWISNCNENDIGNLHNLPIRGKELIISKAYKDHRVIRNIGFGFTNVIWTMNEGCIPHPKILLDLTLRFELITIFYDNDQPGRDAAEKLKQAFLTVNPICKVRTIWLPQRQFPHKDPSDFVKKEGRKDTQEVFKYIGLNPIIK